MNLLQGIMYAMLRVVSYALAIWFVIMFWEVFLSFGVVAGIYKVYTKYN